MRMMRERANRCVFLLALAALQGRNNLGSTMIRWGWVQPVKLPENGEWEADRSFRGGSKVQGPIGPQSARKVSFLGTGDRLG